MEQLQSLVGAVVLEREDAAVLVEVRFVLLDGHRVYLVVVDLEVHVRRVPLLLLVLLY